jgi:hypothetical protein
MKVAEANGNSVGIVEAEMDVGTVDGSVLLIFCIYVETHDQMHLRHGHLLEVRPWSNVRSSGYELLQMR